MVAVILIIVMVLVFFAGMLSGIALRRGVSNQQRDSEPPYYGA